MVYEASQSSFEKANYKMPRATKKTEKANKSRDLPKGSDLYLASIKLFGKLYTANGETAVEAISKLEVGKVAKGASVLTITKGDRIHSKILNTVQVMRLFTPSRVMREVALKQVSSLFDF